MAKRYPVILKKISEGALHMSGIRKLSGALLMSEDPEELIEQASGLTKREIMELVAELHPAPDRPARIDPNPLSPGRYHLSVTVSGRTAQLIEQAQDLGAPEDLEKMLEEALTDYRDKLLTKRLRTISKPGRKISTPILREVYLRDGGRCTFEGEQGRCTETRHLHFDHVKPVAHGGAAVTADDIRLLCAGHNQHEARRLLGDAFMDRKIAERRHQLGPDQAGPRGPEASGEAARCEVRVE